MEVERQDTSHYIVESERKSVFPHCPLQDMKVSIREESDAAPPEVPQRVMENSISVSVTTAAFLPYHL